MGDFKDFYMTVNGANEDFYMTFDGLDMVTVLPMINPSKSMSLDIPLIQINNLKPKRVIFNPPATIVYWEDGTKTVVKTSESCKDIYDEEYGLAMAYVKKIFGSRIAFKKLVNKYKQT